MPDSLADVRILLIQARDTADMEHQEQVCFVERCRLPLEQFRPANVVRDTISVDLLTGVDGMMIGGAGEYSVTKTYPWTDDLLDLIRVAHDRDLPIFGSCWGHQLIATALGGTVITDKERAEFGCGFVELTEAGLADPLFDGVSRRFRANLGHRDRVIDLPEGGIELAFNASQPNQAFRIRDKPIYGTQFHTELDAQRERERLIKYRHHYIELMGDDEVFEQVLQSLAPTTEADHLMHDFVVTYMLEG
ncbi:MAG: type 1 glutamine amidotransferase [Bacteroidetes bacterium]|jgi:GMP synthase (glutamine-hydrolysing)|nr:type 1 glutamine amidotransferase [Bacteroidota bacterium]